MPLAAAVLGGAAIVGGLASAHGASKAAKAQQAAATDASASQERIAALDRAQQQQQYQQTRNDFAPYRNVGVGGLNNLAQVSGIGYAGSQGEFDANRYRSENPDLAAAGYTDQGLLEHWNQYGKNEGRASPYTGGFAGRAAGAPDMSPFFTSPDYAFRRSEGQRDIGNSFAARGGAFSGNALKALSEYNSNLAAGEFGNWWQRQAGLADAGQGGTAQVANAGANAANATTNINQNLSSGIARNTLAAGDARASGISGQYNALGDTIGMLGGLGASYFANNPTQRRNQLYGNQYAMTGSGPRF